MRFGDGAPLGPRHFTAAARALGDAMEARQFEIDMRVEAHLTAEVETAKARSKATRRRGGFRHR